MIKLGEYIILWAGLLTFSIVSFVFSLRDFCKHTMSILDDEWLSNGKEENVPAIHGGEHHNGCVFIVVWRRLVDPTPPRQS